MSTDAKHSVPKANRLKIHDLPVDVLFLILSSLHVQDIARFIRVCRCFADLIHSDLSLQYRIELALNGMVNGESSSLHVSERLQRLRQYSSKFRDGIFDHEDHTAHPDFTLQIRNLRGSSKITPLYPDCTSSFFYGNRDGQSESFLSVFTHGSAQAGIQSHRWLVPVGTAQGRLSRPWALDGAQDLLLVSETSQMAQMQGRVHFYSLSRSMATPTAHPAATLPCLQVVPSGGFERLANVHVFNLCIAGEHVIWQIGATRGDVRNYSIQVCNWRSGQVISRSDLGTQPMHVVPLHYPYLLITPQGSASYFEIYSISPSFPIHRICTLALPNDIARGRYRIWSGEHPAPSEGHFRADPSLSVVTLAVYTMQYGQSEPVFQLLIPRATFSTQIRAAESRMKDSTEQPPDSAPVPVPWKDWGPHGCLRLRPRWGHQQTSAWGRLIPFGSRQPVLVFDDPDFQTAWVYVFDVNPLAARYARQVLAARRRGDSETTAIVEDVEQVLPGVVDPDCSAIPYVVYRFKLPYSPAEWAHGHRIRSVYMTMTGFAVEFEPFGFEESVHTWTV